MKRIRHAMRALLFAVVMLASLVVPVGTASAASDYDDVIQPVDTLHLSRNGSTQGGPTCAEVDYTALWSTILVDPASWTSRTQYVNTDYSDVMNAWSATLNLGTGWAVSQIRYNSVTDVSGDPLGDAIKLVFTPTPTARVVFSSAPIYFGAQKQAYLESADDTSEYTILIQFQDRRWNYGLCMPVVSLAIKDSNSPYVEWRTVAATSTRDTGGYSLQPLVVNAHIDYPVGYEGSYLTALPPVPKYVALGDSYSSGEGNPSFDTWTDRDGTNECHRSQSAYPRLLQREVNLGAIAFVACSSATIENVLYGGTGSGSWNEPPQILALSPEVEIVTITIGGNDIGFATYAANCAVATCGPSSVPYDNIMSAINDPAFRVDLIEVYTEILEHSGQAKLYVLGYPYLTPDLSATDCTHTPDANDLGPRQVVDRLNAVIYETIQGVKSGQGYFDRIKYVDANELNPPSPFLGKYVCGSDPYFNGVDLANPEYSYHPNLLGQQAYKELMVRAVI